MRRRVAVAANAKAADRDCTAAITAARVDGSKRAGRHHLEIVVHKTNSSIILVHFAHTVQHIL